MENVIPMEVVPQKRGRHRKRQLYNAILQQMEFYFSDANISKDRFLAQLTSNDPYVDITIFLKFNKIRKLTTSVKDITKALSKSEILILSEDETKVCRKLPFKKKENVDECTIYIERLNSDATHEWLKSIFSEFGNVVYVSIPKYKNNGIIKGFAFLEFDTEESTQAALQYFEKNDCKLCSSLDPEKLCSVATFLIEKKLNKQENNLNKSKPKDKKTDEIKKNIEDKNEEEMPKKRKHSDNSDSDGEKQKKKHKTCSEELSNDDIFESESKTNFKKEQSDDCKFSNGKQENANMVNNKKSKTINNVVIETENKHISETEQQNNNKSTELVTHPETATEIEIEEKKKKKTKKQHKKKLNLHDIGLQILSKSEWKKLRNRYLDMQRKTMNVVKQHVYKDKFARTYKDKDFFEPEVPDSEQVAIKQFTPGLIAKLTLTEPCMDNKKLKEEINSKFNTVRFIDIPFPSGSAEIFLRFLEPNGTKNFCSSNFKGSSYVLENEEEEIYWKKIEESRTAKQKKSTIKQRGRKKLLKKAEQQAAKHMRFEDNE